tara:strand:+ start:10348 stop:12081 length:1734 start_codon:yes stop_codon:yes gene_type:complete
MSAVFKRLQPGTITITPFKAYKRWNKTVDNQDSSSGYRAVEGINYTGHFYTTEERDSSGIYKRNIFNLVHKLYYQFEHDPALTFTNNQREAIEKNDFNTATTVPFPTWESASISHIIMPTLGVGERVKPGTFSIKSKSGSLDGQYFDDDGIGHLYSRTISSSWDTTNSSSYWPSETNLKGYWKFDKLSDPLLNYADTTEQLYRQAEFFTLPADNQNGNLNAVIGTNYEEMNKVGSLKIYRDSDTTLEGMSLQKYPEKRKTGVRLVKHEALTGQNKQTWTLWFKPTGHQNAGTTYGARIITRDVSEYWGLIEKPSDNYDTDGQCGARFFFGNGVSQTINNGLISGSWHFAAISIDYTVGSASAYLWNETNGWNKISKHTGGIRSWDGSHTGSQANSNKKSVVLGCNSEHQDKPHVRYDNFSGSYDEVRYYDTNLSEEQIHCLKDFPRGAQQSFVGDIWYNQGSAVVKTQGQYKNLALGVGTDGYEVTYDSTVTIYEHEYRCRSNEDDHNYTINGSLMDSTTLDSSKMIGVSTHSLFAPYVTTIGLYNDNYELLAIGKLGRAIKTSVETPITYVVRIDL